MKVVTRTTLISATSAQEMWTNLWSVGKWAGPGELLLLLTGVLFCAAENIMRFCPFD